MDTPSSRGWNMGSGESEDLFQLGKWLNDKHGIATTQENLVSLRATYVALIRAFKMGRRMKLRPLPSEEQLESPDFGKGGDA